MQQGFKKFKNALKDISDVCKFEMWLRFYFVEEEKEKLFLKIPEEVMEHIKEEYAHLFEFAKRVNNQDITPEKSQKMILEFISEEFDGEKYDSQLIPSVLNSKSLEVELSLFHVWVKAYEKDLDEKVFSFREWMELFEAWKRTKDGQNILNALYAPKQTDRRDQ